MSAPTALNETHDPLLQSWVTSANAGRCDFPIQNLPFGVFRRAGCGEAFRGGAAIGDAIVDLAALYEARVYSGAAAEALAFAHRAPLNEFMALGNDAVRALRAELSLSLRAGSPLRSAIEPHLVSQKTAEMALPAHIGDYTDFYTSLYHALAVGKLFRPEAPLLPNYKWVPVGYHGRASSIVISGTEIAWPSGQRLPSGAAEPVFGPSERLDYEMELGIFIGRGNDLGRPIAIDRAEDHIFGFCLLNDWSARDLQAWEYQPLGPFLAKNFATTLSPWIVTLEALAPYRVPFRRPPDDPQPLDYLVLGKHAERAAFDIHVSATLQTEAIRTATVVPAELGRATYVDAYWTASQLVAHHTVSGCNLRPGDLLGTGTLSGPMPEQAGSLLELSAGGRVPFALPGYERRTFLVPGDRVTLRGRAGTGARVGIGFGEATGIVQR